MKVVWRGVGTPGLATRPAEVFKFQFLLLLGEAASGPPWRMVIGADFVPQNLARLGDMIVTALEVLLMSGGLKPELFSSSSYGKDRTYPRTFWSKMYGPALQGRE